jgi:RND family efflux transporter MFP subunit
VKNGQTIATITNPQFIILQEEYLSSEAKIKYAQLEYNRQKELSSGNAGALKNYQLSETELQNLKTRKASIKKQLELIGINTSRLNNDNMSTVVAITSPTNGAVSNVMVNIGSNVDINTPIAEVVDNSQLHLDLYVYEKDLPRIKVGQTIHFTLTNNPGREYDAEIFGIGNTFEDATKALSVHAKVKGNKTGLIDGMNITALVSLENAIVPAVPTDAIVNYQGQDYIYIVNNAESLEENHADPKSTKHKEHQHKEAEKPLEEPTTFERIPIRKGTTDIGYSEITLLKEIPANTKIVTKGAFFILAKQTNSGEHEH